MEAIPMTKEGYERLKLELHNLKTVERPKIIEEIAVARSHGDLRENAEYHAAREKQGFIEARITLLDDHIARASVIDFSGQKVEEIKFGAFVSVEDEESGETKTYRIVGDVEADITQNLISVNSPIGRALMGKRVGDLIEVDVPKGHLEYAVIEIKY
jgi:transcription elongation factor GreA